MENPKHPTPDRRAAPRFKAQLDCRIIFEGNEYDAFIKDISPMGAFLWSAFMPPPAADVSIKVETSFIRTPLTLDGKIVRRECRETEQGTMGAFAVKFKTSSPALTLLISKLTNPQIL